MPKQKSHSGSKKRFRFSGKGKPIRSRGAKKHKATCKTTKQKRNLRGVTVASDADAKRIQRALPYGKK